MAQMYKVFIDDRVIFFVEKLPENIKNIKGAIVYRYYTAKELCELINAFHQSMDHIGELFIHHEDGEKLFQKFRTEYTFIQAAGGVVYNENNEVLVIKRKGKWDIPKGKIEEGEDIRDGAIREVEEECNIQAPRIQKKLLTTYHMYVLENEPVVKETHWFEMAVNGNDRLIPQTQESITEVKWMKRDNMDEVFHNTFGSIKELLRYI